MTGPGHESGRVVSAVSSPEHEKVIKLICIKMHVLCDHESLDLTTDDPSNFFCTSQREIKRIDLIIYFALLANFNAFIYEI